MILIIPLITLSGFSFAQGKLDVYRFSNQRNLGTAFSAGMAGATGSVGSDATSFSVNPAALSLYRFSEFTAGIFINQFAAENMYIGQETRSKRGSFNFSNLSFVNTNMLFERGREPSDEMVSYGFGFSYQRLAEFNRSIEFQGQNKRSSIVDDFWEQAQGYIDYYIKDWKIAIEYNGDLFHANPKKYKGDDKPIPGSNITAFEIWEKDRIKKETLLKEKNIIIIEVWEDNLPKYDELIKEIYEKRRVC